MYYVVRSRSNDQELVRVGRPWYPVLKQETKELKRHPVLCGQRPRRRERELRRLLPLLDWRLGLLVTSGLGWLSLSLCLGSLVVGSGSVSLLSRL